MRAYELMKHNKHEPLALSCFLYIELGEEGLLLDALAVVAQPLAAVVSVLDAGKRRAASLHQTQLTLHCKEPPYQLQLQLRQVSHCGLNSCWHVILLHQSASADSL